MSLKNNNECLILNLVSFGQVLLIRIIAKKVKTFKTLNISIGIVIVIIYFVTNDQLKVEL